MDNTFSKESGKIFVEVKENIAIIHMQCGQNRFNDDFVNKLCNALDEVESNPDIKAVITTGAGKFYSNGLDLTWLASMKDEPHKIIKFMNVTNPTLKMKLLTFPMPTIAAINGHCFAAGAMTALCHDYRIMRTGRGWFSINEVHVGITFHKPAKLLAKSKLPSGPVIDEAVVAGRQYTAEEAAQRGIISLACDNSQLLANALSLAHRVTKRGPYNRQSLRDMKTLMFKELIDVMERQKSKDIPELLSRI